MDSSVPLSIINFLNQWTVAIYIMVAASFFLPALIFVMVIIAVVNVYYGIQFVSASRDLKRLDSVTRSPLFTQFSEAIVGTTTIRAFGMTQEFMFEMLNKIDVSARSMYYAGAIARWISVQSAFTGAIVTLVTCLFILFNLDNLNAAAAGFCLTYVPNFTSMVM